MSSSHPMFPPIDQSYTQPEIKVTSVDQRDNTNFEPIGRKRLLPEDSAARKQYPMCEGLFDYFPDALAATAQISFKGNQKHNPGEPLHHSRGKSMDHADCIARHLVERGGRDAAGNRHSAQLVWRALALLQEELEREYNLPLPRNARYDVVPDKDRGKS